MITREELVHIGKITKSHGLNGELEININSELFEECETPYIIVETDGIFIPFFIVEYRYKNESTYLFSCKGIDNEMDAKELIKRDIYIHKKFLAEGIDVSVMEGNSYFIGFSIFSEEEKYIGEVVDIDDTTENVLFLLHDKNGNELIIPASDDFVVNIDEQRKIIIMSLPEGLLSL
mgnify:FL=1